MYQNPSVLYATRHTPKTASHMNHRSVSHPISAILYNQDDIGADLMVDVIACERPRYVFWRKEKLNLSF